MAGVGRQLDAPRSRKLPDDPASILSLFVNEVNFNAEDFVVAQIGM
jgi:hypothetical protein